MKRILTALIILSSLSSFAAPWELKKKLQVVNVTQWVQPFSKPAFDTYVTGCWSFEISPNYQPNHACRIQVDFNESVPEPYYVVVSVLGDWAQAPGYASEKYFTILFNTGQWRRVVDYPMSPVEEIYPQNTYALDYGPQ